MSTTPKPQASTSVSRPGELARVYVWEAPVWITHWLITLSIVVLIVTGFYIGNPFLIAAGPAKQRFVMGTVKVIHYYAAMTFTLSELTRIGWMFLGNQYARWDQFIPVTAQRRREIWPVVQLYLFLRTKPPDYLGHNPLAGLSYAIVFLLGLLMSLTGLGLYGLSDGAGGYMRVFAFFVSLFGGAQTTRWIHHATMWAFVFFVVHHVYSAWFFSSVQRGGEVDSIFSGWKFSRPR